MLGAVVTTIGPDVAPDGIVREIEVLLQVTIVTSVPLSLVRPTCDPKFDPEIVTWLPAAPVVAESPLIIGAAVLPDVMETLSKLAVARFPVLPLATPRPT